MSETPDFVGQTYKDTITGNIWKANSLASGDWSLDLQNCGFRWSPASANPLQDLYLFVGDGFTGVTHFSFDFQTYAGINIAFSTSLIELSFPNLVSIDPTDLESYTNSISNCALLETINFPLLQYSSGEFQISTNAKLVNLDLSSLVTVKYGDFTINVNPLLTSINIPNFVPENGQQISFINNALDDTSVNLLLARCVANAAYVSGSISLIGGTNSAPTGQGLTDKATLIGRGVTVQTN